MSEVKEKDKKVAKKSLDYIFESVVGGGSWYQWTTVFAMVPLMMSGEWPLTLFLFTSYIPEHRCRVPICDLESANSTTVEADFLEFAVPRSKHNAKEFLNDGYAHDPCNAHDVIDPEGGCNAGNFDLNSTMSCDAGFVYSQDFYPETLSTRFDLVCDSEAKQRLLGTLTMTGLLIGSVVGGRSGDYLGRKTCLYSATVVILLAVAISGLSTSYIMFAACHLIYSSAMPISWMCHASITTEFFSPGYRKYLVCAKDSFGIPVVSLMVFIAYMVRDWRYLQLTIAVVSVLSLVSWFFTDESVRWLAQNDKKQEAKRILLKIAKRNGRKLGPEQMEEIDTILKDVAAEDKKGGNRLSPLHMFKKHYVKRTSILILGWICTNVGYFSLALNSTKLHGNIFLNYYLASLADAPTCVIFLITLDRFGRKWNLVFFQALLGVCCLVLAFLPKEHHEALLFVYCVGKLGAAASFALVWLITIELYPTNLRTQAIGTCSSIARVFGLGCPFVANLAVYWKPLPMLLLGTPTLLVAGLMTKLPETAHMDLPQDFQDGADLELNNDDEEKSENEEEMKGDEAVGNGEVKV